LSTPQTQKNLKLYSSMPQPAHSLLLRPLPVLPILFRILLKPLPLSSDVFHYLKDALYP